ncbi:MAG: cytochrome c-type biogenesis protein [Paracoccaceae bacterium]|jgi:cytochrome c-type biogenesis protein CcmH
MIRVLLVLLALATPVWAVQPDEMLADPVLEARAREISREVRCPVCQGETIDDSNARISHDLRIIIRERLVAGDSDDQVLDFLVDRYGEFVLFNPRKSGVNLILWLAGPAMLLAGGGIAYVAIRRRKAGTEEGLSAEEQARLDELLKG